MSDRIVTSSNQPGFNIGGSFRVDTSDLLRMSYAFEQGPKIVQREMLKGMRLAAQDTKENVRAVAPIGKAGNTPIGGSTGKLRANIDTRVTLTNSLRGAGIVGNRGGGVTGEVMIKAAKVPYAWWVNNGRGAIRPRTKKWLRFRWHGNIVFTKYVKPKAGSFFMEKGLANSKADIGRAMDSAADRVTRFLTGTGR